MPEIELSIKDRIILSNQYRILEAVDEANAELWSRNRKIVESGYEIEYQNLHAAFDERSMTSEQCREVLDILEMHFRLILAFEKLADKTGIDPNDIQFFGFDGNNEPYYLGYATFLKEQNKYPEIPVSNSHMPSLGIYRRMLKAWNESAEKYSLTQADIQRIVASRVHPDNR